MLNKNVVIVFIMATSFSSSYCAFPEIDVNIKAQVTEAPMTINGTVTIPPKYFGVGAGICGGVYLTTKGVQEACSAMTTTRHCTKNCSHIGLLPDSDSRAAICPDKQGSCWRLRTPQCHKAASLLTMGALTTGASFLAAYYMNMLGS